MRKSILLSIAILLALHPHLFAERVRIGIFAHYFTPGDALLQEIYGESGDLLYGMRLNALVWKGLQASVSYGQYKKFSQTTELGDITRLTLNPLTFGVRYSAPLGRFSPFVEVAYMKLAFKEEADIGGGEGQANGWCIVGGLEYLMSNRFGLSLEIRTQQADGPTGSNGLPVSFKGTSGGLSFFVRI